MLETVGYITELIANDFYKGLSHTVLGPAGVNLFMSCSLLDINVFLRIFIVCLGFNGGYGASFWTLVRQRCTYVC